MEHTMESHEPVHRLRASLLTPRQLTRLSWPCSVPTRSPRRTSHTCVLSDMPFSKGQVDTDLALEIIVTSE